MAELVIGLATSHLAMVLRDPEERDKEKVKRFRDGFGVLRQALDQSDADVLIVVSAEHVNKFFLDNLPALAIGTAERYHGPVENIPIAKRYVAGARNMAMHMLHHGLQNGIDWARAEDWELDHGMMVPLHFLDPEGARKIIPVFINCAAPPYPAMARCYEVGGRLRQAIASYPAPDKVAIVACGGLSHSPGDERMGFIDEAFDRKFLDLLASGQGRQAAAIPEERVEAAGSSSGEIRSWLCLAGAFADERMDIITYEAIGSYGTGCAQAIARNKGKGATSGGK